MIFLFFLRKQLHWPTFKSMYNSKLNLNKSMGKLKRRIVAWCIENNYDSNRKHVGEWIWHVFPRLLEMLLLYLHYFLSAWLSTNSYLTLIIYFLLTRDASRHQTIINISHQTTPKPSPTVNLLPSIELIKKLTTCFSLWLSCCWGMQWPSQMMMEMMMRPLFFL